jgi:hypothetical protein
MKITRRDFLAGLLSVGATIALPVPLAQATQAQVDTAWKQLLDEPWYFEVNGSRTIVEADADEPEIRSDVFEGIWVAGIKTPEDLIREVDGCTPLGSHFRTLAALDDFDGEWEDWVRKQGVPGLQGLMQEVNDWLDSPVEPEDFQWFPIRSGAQGQAMAFFESLDDETLDALGVVIIEGEHPGSSYYAAELRKPIDVANAAAKALVLPFRFKVQGHHHG